MTSSRIDKLLEKKRQIDAQIKDAQARDRAKKRKEDTRQKIIAGALALEHAERNPNSEFSLTMLRLIQEGVKTDRERALFGLDPLPPSNDTATTPPKPTSLWKRVTKS